MIGRERERERESEHPRKCDAIERTRHAFTTRDGPSARGPYRDRTPVSYTLRGYHRSIIIIIIIIICFSKQKTTTTSSLAVARVGAARQRSAPTHALRCIIVESILSPGGSNSARNRPQAPCPHKAFGWGGCSVATNEAKRRRKFHTHAPRSRTPYSVGQCGANGHGSFCFCLILFLRFFVRTQPVLV